MEGLPPQLRMLIGRLKEQGYEIDENDPAQIMSVLQALFRDREDEEDSGPETIPEKVLSTLDVEGVAKWIKEGKAKKIIVMVGAGLSTAAGIPDFRTPGTGLYDNLQKYNLPSPQAIFSIDYFQNNPGAFYELAREMWPGTYCPTKAHFFLKLLEDKDLLLRCYSQNIDSLEELAGVSKDLIIAAHGNFSSARGLDSRESVPISEVKEAVMRGEKGWREMTEKRGELVKPDIVFFGEELPERFNKGIRKDFPECDLLIVMGTSLVVAPFCNCITFVNDLCPRLLINREHAGLEKQANGGRMRGGFRFTDEERNYRDAFFEGDCDAGVKLCVICLAGGMSLIVSQLQVVLLTKRPLVTLQTLRTSWANSHSSPSVTVKVACEIGLRLVPTSAMECQIWCSKKKEMIGDQFRKGDTMVGKEAISGKVLGLYQSKTCERQQMKPPQ